MRVLILLLLILPFTGLSQHSKGKPKKSFARGTLYAYWGYNRSAYSKSNLHFIGPGYDFTLKGSVARDNPTPLSAKVYYNPKLISNPQFNARIGYYFRDHYAISIGFDQMKYIFSDQNQVLLSGTINPGVDTVTSWSGTYNNEAVTTDRTNFHYENSGGLSYLRLGFTRTDNLWQMGDWLMISSNVGLGIGGIRSSNDFKFAGQEDLSTASLSGYGLSAHAGLRFEFLKHMFIQNNFSGGFIHQTHVRTRQNEPNAFVKQKYAYFMFETAVGILLYIRPTNDCNSCPNW